jgi:catechol 2,3-dioxygenase-like lactoylglutathione lyase family enzyme
MGRDEFTPSAMPETAYACVMVRHTTTLGAFSVSLAVRDLRASQAFYEKLGFEAFAGQPEQNWVILQNGSATIGLFQGMFEKNILTFNPGWDQSAKPLETFDDVREVQRRLRAQGIEPKIAADEASQGPGSLIIEDPDGNPILLDQHV